MTSVIDLEDTYEYQVCRNSYAINDILVGTLFAGPVGSSSPPDQFLHESDLPGVALFFLINPYILFFAAEPLSWVLVVQQPGCSLLNDWADG